MDSWAAAKAQESFVPRLAGEGCADCGAPDVARWVTGPVSDRLWLTILAGAGVRATDSSRRDRLLKTLGGALFSAAIEKLNAVAKKVYDNNAVFVVVTVTEHHAIRTKRQTPPAGEVVSAKFIKGYSKIYLV